MANSKPMTDKETVLTFFREKTRKPLSFREIVSLMELGHKEGRALKRLLRTMVRSGELVLTRKGLFGPPEDMNLANGYFEAHRELLRDNGKARRDLTYPPGQRRVR
jgi:exoribonuclease R